MLPGGLLSLFSADTILPCQCPWKVSGVNNFLVTRLATARLGHSSGYVSAALDCIWRLSPWCPGVKMFCSPLPPLHDTYYTVACDFLHKFTENWGFCKPAQVPTYSWHIYIYIYIHVYSNNSWSYLSLHDCCYCRYMLCTACFSWLDAHTIAVWCNIASFSWAILTT